MLKYVHWILYGALTLVVLPTLSSRAGDYPFTQALWLWWTFCIIVALFIAVMVRSFGWRKGGG